MFFDKPRKQRKLTPKEQLELIDFIREHGWIFDGLDDYGVKFSKMFGEVNLLMCMRYPDVSKDGGTRGTIASDSWFDLGYGGRWRSARLVDWGMGGWYMSDDCPLIECVEYAVEKLNFDRFFDEQIKSKRQDIANAKRKYERDVKNYEEWIEELEKRKASVVED